MSKKLSYLLLLFTLALCCPHQVVHAGPSETLLQLNGDGMEELYGSEEFVSIATGSSKPAYKAPAVASVITARQIEAMGATTLDEVLEKVPGLHVGVSTQGRLDSVYSIRGIHTKFNPQVLLLMNGISFPSFTGGRPLQFHLPVEAIERIEVIRGPGSAVYGADAFAGVINIITKDSQDINGTVVGTRHGSFDTHNSWLQHGSSYAGWDLAFSVEQQKSAGDSNRIINSDLQSILDSNLSNAPGPLDTRYNLVDTHLEISRKNWKFRHWYWHQDDAGMGAGAAFALDPNGGEDADQHLADLSWQSDQLLTNWDLEANLNYLHHRSESRFNLLPAGTNAPIGSDGNLNLVNPTRSVFFTDGMIGKPDGTDQQYGLDLTAFYRGLSSHQIRFGSGFKYHEVWITSEEKNFGPGSPLDGSMTQVTDTPYVFLPDSDRTAYYLSIQDEWNFAPDWELTAGIRLDSYSDFGETINPRLALVWSTRHNLTTKLLYGRAFRAPSFVELYSINNPVALGNPQLDPETIDTLELAFDYRLTFNLQTNLSFYYYQADDLIEFVPDSSGSTATAQNARDQQGYGLELEVLWQATQKLKIQGNYALQHSEDVATGNRIADAPGQELYLSANWKFLPDWSVETQLNWVADRKRAANDTRPQIDDYSIVNLTLHKNNILKRFDVSVAARNLFDTDAYEPSRAGIPGFTGDYPLAGRSFWAEVSYRF
ncbi:MAG TPA: TonB-dependent receptor [Malonomonas sp.]